MEERTWYLGPLNDLRALDVPDAGVTTTPVRYQGVHQALSGARTVDFLGVRHEYELSFEYLDEQDWIWLEALYEGLVPGPYYLIDPLKKNRLSVAGCGLRDGVRDATAVAIWNWQYQMSRVKPGSVNLPVESIILEAPGSGQTYLFDPRVPTPVVPGEQITASIHARGSAGRTIQMVMHHHGPDGRRLGTAQSAATMNMTTSWNRYSMPLTVPAGVHAIRLGITTGTGSADVQLCAPQIEGGTTATSWRPGGGGVQVVLDSIPTSSPRWPLKDCSVSLLET